MQLGKIYPVILGNHRELLRNAFAQRWYRFNVGCHTLFFSCINIRFLGRFYTKVVGDTQNSKKNLRTGVYFANFYVYFFSYEFDGYKKNGRNRLKNGSV